MNRFSILFLLAFTSRAFAAGPAPDTSDFPTFPDDPAATAPAAPGYSVDTPIAVLAASPAAASVLRQELPGLLEDASYPLFKTMPLKTVAALSGGRISAECLKQVDAELKAIPVSVASRTGTPQE